MANLAEMRSRLRINQTDLSLLTGIQQSRLSLIETLMSAPTASERAALEKLGIRFDTLGIPSMPVAKWNADGSPNFRHLDEEE